jgi:hypothetical protein
MGSTLSYSKPGEDVRQNLTVQAYEHFIIKDTHLTVETLKVTAGGILELTEGSLLTVTGETYLEGVIIARGKFETFKDIFVEDTGRLSAEGIVRFKAAQPDCGLVLSDNFVFDVKGEAE